MRLSVAGSLCVGSLGDVEWAGEQANMQYILVLALGKVISCFKLVNNSVLRFYFLETRAG
jgi:hypothetical protein